MKTEGALESSEDVEFVLGSSATWDSEQPKEYDDTSAPPHTVEAINFKTQSIATLTL
jgi:hypothetical protein